MICLIYYLHLFHSQKEGIGCNFKCNTCSKRFTDDDNEYNKYNTKKGHKKDNHVVTQFKQKEDLIDDLKRKCIMRKCNCSFNLGGGPKSYNGCPDNQLCRTCYSKYFAFGQLREGKEETWKNAEKKKFLCQYCNTPFNYKEDRDYHCKNTCPR